MVLVISISGCKAKPNIKQITAKSSKDTAILRSTKFDVYVSGFRSSKKDSVRFIAYWKNGKPIYLRDRDSSGNKISVSNLGVYNDEAVLFGTVRSKEGNRPFIWKEGKEYVVNDLPVGTNVFFTNGAFDQNGASLFIQQSNSTEDIPESIYWKDEKKIVLSNPKGYNTEAFEIVTGDTNVYVFGEAYQTGVNHRSAINQKVFWKNGVPILLGEDINILVVKIIGNNLYTVERTVDEYNNSNGFVVKKNGEILEKIDFDKYRFTPHCIDVYGANVYIGGNISNPNPNPDKIYSLNPNCEAAYFRDNKLVKIGNFMKLCDLKVNQENVYITAIKFLMEKETEKKGLYGNSMYNVPQQIILLKDSIETKLTGPIDGVLIDPKIGFNN